MVSQIYPAELQLNNVNTSDTEASFLDLHLSISNDILFLPSPDFDFEIVNFRFLDGWWASLYTLRILYFSTDLIS